MICEMVSSSFSAVLLAGGRSVRMGLDKARLDWNGVPLWQLQSRKLQSLNPQRLIISCREEQGLHLQASGVEWVFDPPGCNEGALSAIHRVLKSVQMPLLVLAVDMPVMTSDFLFRLIYRARGWCFRTASGLEPLAAMYVPEMVPFFDEALRVRNLSLQTLCEQCSQSGCMTIIDVPAENEMLFANANTPQEWEHEKSRSR